jgi:outer membrane protein assembly factor BamB
VQTPVWLAVDLGTTHTVAVVGRAGQEPRSLLFDGSPLLPSGVFLDAEGGLHTGRDAQRLAAAERFEPHPKRRIDDGTVLLGDREVPVEDVLATGLRRVAEEAAASGLSPAQTVLTYPADWGPVRRAILERAAHISGLGPVRLLAEPIAAATYCAEVLGREIPRGGTVAIFDFGGGTFDVAVVRREDDATGRLRTLAVGGLDDLGGLDVDMALAAHLGRIVAAKDTALWKRLFEPETTADLRERLAFWGEVRAAKEMLSRTSTAPVALPGHNPMGLHLTRDELQSLADPLVARAVDETRRTLERAGVDPAGLTALLLVGGSSRMPLVATRLHARLGVAPSVPEQPELPVAFGALRFAVTDQSDPAASTPPATPPAGAPGLQYAPYPVGGLPSPSPMQSPVRTPVPSPAGTLPPRTDLTPHTPFRPTVHDRPPMPRSAKRAVVGVVATAIAIVVVLAIAISQFDWDGLTGDFSAGELIDGVEGLGDSGPELSLVHERQLSGTGASAVVASADMAILAEVDAGQTTVHALGTGGDELWTQSYELEPSDLYLTVVSDVLVIDAMASATDEGQNMRAAADLATGELLWKQPWIDRNDLAYFGHDAIVEQRAGIYDNAVIRIDLTTGEEVWKEKGPESLFIIDEYRARAATVWDDGDSPGAVPPNSHALFDNLAATDRIVDLDPDAGTAVVRDAATGDAVHDGGLAIDSEQWTVFDDLVIGRASEEVSPGRDTLIAYSLADFGEAWNVPLDVSFTIQEVKACGPHLICAALDHSDADDQYKTVAYDTATGEQRWEVAVDWAVEDHWYTSPDGLVHGDQVFDAVDAAKIIDFEGGITLGDGEPITMVLAARQGRAVVLDYGGTGFEVAVLDMATGESSAAVDVGPDLAEHAFLAGDLFVVLTGDKRVLVYTVPDLA